MIFDTLITFAIGICAVAFMQGWFRLCEWIEKQDDEQTKTERNNNNQ